MNISEMVRNSLPTPSQNSKTKFRKMSLFFDECMRVYDASDCSRFHVPLISIKPHFMLKTAFLDS